MLIYHHTAHSIYTSKYCIDIDLAAQDVYMTSRPKQITFIFACVFFYSIICSINRNSTLRIICLYIVNSFSFNLSKCDQLSYPIQMKSYILSSVLCNLTSLNLYTYTLDIHPFTFYLVYPLSFFLFLTAEAVRNGQGIVQTHSSETGELLPLRYWCSFKGNRTFLGCGVWIYVALTDDRNDVTAILQVLLHLIFMALMITFRTTSVCAPLRR